MVAHHIWLRWQPSLLIQARPPGAALCSPGTQCVYPSRPYLGLAHHLGVSTAALLGYTHWGTNDSRSGCSRYLGSRHRHLKISGARSNSACPCCLTCSFDLLECERLVATGQPLLPPPWGCSCTGFSSCNPWACDLSLCILKAPSFGSCESAGLCLPGSLWQGCLHDCRACNAQPGEKCLWGGVHILYILCTLAGPAASSFGCVVQSFASKPPAGYGCAPSWLWSGSLKLQRHAHLLVVAVAV